MRTITTHTNVYTFEELSEDAKEKAINDLRDINVEFDWWDGIYYDYKMAASIIGIYIDDIEFSGFSSQGDGASFTGSYSYMKGWREKLRDEFGGNLMQTIEKVGQQLQDAQAKVFYTGTASISHSGRYSHSGCMDVSVDCEKGDIETFEDEIRDCLRWFADDIYNALERDYDYLTSDEAVNDTILANEYEFTEEGKLI